MTTFDIGGEVDFHACNSTNSSSESIIFDFATNINLSKSPKSNTFVDLLT